MCIYGEHPHRFTIDSYLMLNTYQKKYLTIVCKNNLNRLKCLKFDLKKNKFNFLNQDFFCNPGTSINFSKNK